MSVSDKAILREYFLKIFAVLAVLGTLTWILIRVDNMLVAFLLGFVIAYLMNPVVNALERRKIDRALGITILFVAGGALVAGGVTYLTPMIGQQISSFQGEMPKYTEGIKTLVADVEKTINERFAFLGNIDIAAKAGDFFQSRAGGFLSALPGLASSILTIMLLAPLFAFFMLRDGRVVTKQLLSMVPNNLFELSLNLIHQINEQLGGFIRARLMESALVGFVVWAGLMFIGFPYSIFLAVIAAITNLIPYIGPVIGALPPFIIAAINKEPSSTHAFIAVTYVTAQILDAVVIIPLVVAKIVNLHPVTVIVTIIIGGQFGGILGMIISIPLTSIAKLTLKSVYDHVINFRV